MLDGRRGRALRRGGAAARCDAHGPDAARSPAEDGDRRARSPRRVRPEAWGRPASWSRSSRCAAAGSSSASSSGREAADRRLERRRGARSGASSSSTSCASRRRKSTCRPSRTNARRSRPGCRSGPAAGCGSWCRSAARSAASSISPTATPRSRTRRASIRTTAAQYEALETLQAVLALPALPRRIECFDISTIQGSETVASMVVCEDGRMRRGDYRKFRIRGLGTGDSGARDGGSSSPSPEFTTPSSSDSRAQFPTTSPPCMKSSLRRYRKLLEQGGPFPDLLLIDGGKGQLSAAYAALEELGLANLVAVGIAKKEELLFTRDRDDPIALAAERSGAAAAFSAFATKRIGSPSRSIAKRGRCATCGPSSTTCPASAAPPPDAADDVRQPGRRAARHARGAGGRVSGRKVADAVLAFFASRP